MQAPIQSPHRRGWQVYKNKFPQVIMTLLFQLLIRAIAFIPFIYAVATGSFFNFNKNYAMAFGFLFSLPLYVLLVMPMRFQAAAKKAQLQGFARDARINGRNYLIWLRAALVRLLRALPFILPFFVFAGLYYYLMPYPDFTVPMLAISRIGDVIGKGFLGGAIITGVVGIASAILAALGWLRGVAFEHQAVIEQGIGLSLDHAHALRKRRKRTIRNTVFKNALLTLPAIIGVMAVIINHLMSLPRVGMLALDYLNAAANLLKFDFPAMVPIMIAVILLVLWLPILPLRKLALCAVMTEDHQAGA